MYHDNNSNTAFGFMCGIIGWLLNQIINIDHVFIINLTESAFTALICGFVGVAGKHFFGMIIKRLKKKK